MTRADVILLVVYAALFVAAWIGGNWLDRRERRRAYDHGRRMASQARFLDKVEGLRRQGRGDHRLDVMRIDGETDEEVIGHLMDGHFHRRSE